MLLLARVAGLRLKSGLIAENNFGTTWKTRKSQEIWEDLEKSGKIIVEKDRSSY